MILTFFLGFSLMFISEYLKRRERDSNPRYPLGVYTLSRRASSTTRASFLVDSEAYSLSIEPKLVCKNRTLVLQ